MNADIRTREELLEESFSPWHTDPRQLARLYRWLTLLDQQPGDAAGFMEHPRKWAFEYEQMLMWGPGPA